LPGGMREGIRRKSGRSENYAHYTDVLRRISHRCKMARVFMSGSAADYAPWEHSKAQELIQELSRRLVAAGFGIVSGFGEGLGPFVVNGILAQLGKDGTQVLDDRIVLRPFSGGNNGCGWTEAAVESLSSGHAGPGRCGRVPFRQQARRLGQHRCRRWNGGRVCARISEALGSRAGWMYRAYGIGASHAGSRQLCRPLSAKRI